MCDQGLLKKWASEEMSRRQMGVLAGAAAVVACTPGESANAADGHGSAGHSMADLTETAVSFETADGTMDAFFVAPSEGKHPAVIFWPDIASIREAKRNMARRLAGEGYAVLVLNPYYRDLPAPQFDGFMDFVSNEGFAKVSPWRGKHNADSIGRDATAAVAWLDRQASVDTERGIGVQGYCMGGPLTVWSAAAVPERIKSAATFHAGGLVTDDPKSPHKVLKNSAASYLIAVAKDDDAKSPQDKAIFAEEIEAADLYAHIEVYNGDHGWTVPDIAPRYVEEAAEKAWADLLAHYKGSL